MTISDLRLCARCLWMAAVCALAFAVYLPVAAEDVLLPVGDSPLNINPETVRFDTTLTANQAAGLDMSAFGVNSGILGTPFYDGVNERHSMGAIILGSPLFDNLSLDLTNGYAFRGVRRGGVPPRTGIRVSWSNRYLVNQPGDDVVITDNGSAGGVEYFLLRAIPLDGAPTPLFYAPADAFQDSDEIDQGFVGALSDVGDFLTSVNLSDFGYPDGARFVALEIWEMLETDRFDSSGFGFVVDGGDTLPYRSPELDRYQTEQIPFQQYDADIGYVFAVSAAHLTARTG